MKLEVLVFALTVGGLAAVSVKAGMPNEMVLCGVIVAGLIAAAAGLVVVDR